MEISHEIMCLEYYIRPGEKKLQRKSFFARPRIESPSLARTDHAVETPKVSLRASAPVPASSTSSRRFRRRPRRARARRDVTTARLRRAGRGSDFRVPLAPSTAPAIADDAAEDSSPPRSIARVGSRRRRRRAVVVASFAASSRRRASRRRASRRLRFLGFPLARNKIGEETKSSRPLADWD